VTRYNFHAYSGGGKLNMTRSLLDKRSELSDYAAEVIYKCQMCGACDMACKVYRNDIDLMEVLMELRTHCVQNGFVNADHLDMIDRLKREDNTLGEPKAGRGDWADGMGIKDANVEKAEVLLHVGCRFSFDRDLWGVIRGVAGLLQKAGVDFAIGGKAETCCGGRAYEMGYRAESEKYVEDTLSRVKASGAKTLLTACSDGYAAFNYLYPRMGKRLPVEVIHVTDFLNRLVKQGRLRLRKRVPLVVTYHDPCHLGRMSEPYIPEWQGDKLQRPPRLKRAGLKGIYDQPRELIQAVPGVKLVEMERRREYSWCCGAGGGCFQAFPDFTAWTGNERIEEALSTGADALVTSCPWCERVFRDSVKESGAKLAVYDVTELMLASLE